MSTKVSGMTTGMKWIILGGTGQLGKALQSELKSQKSDSVVFVPENINVVKHTEVFELITHFKPNFVVNCAAWTNVRQAEFQEEEANQVNGWAVQNIGLAAKECNAKLVHISTDYVFSGNSENSYGEDENLCPINAYGRSKALGENLLRQIDDGNSLILRTAWLYGKHRSNFLKTILSKYLSHQDKIGIVNDQFGNPTSAVDLAKQIVNVTPREIPGGNYHAVNTGSTSWFGLADKAFSLLGLNRERLVPIRTQDSETLSRPWNTSLDSNKWESIGMSPMRPWKEALESEIHAILEQVEKENQIGF
jgi:dTDP-4-dehydrorhamnose reductase